jgi:predicted RNase H-like HicB family nuclease
MSKMIAKGVLSKYSVPMPVVFCNGGKWVQAWCPLVDVASQGKNFEEAKKNIEEALDMYFQDKDTPKPALKSLLSMSVSVTTVPVKIEDLKNAKNTSAVCA